MTDKFDDRADEWLPNREAADSAVTSLAEKLDGRRYSTPMRPKFEWTRKREAELIRLWLGGKSGREIAIHFGQGLTRSAVIGKVHRLKLAKRNGPDNESHRITSKLEARKRRVTTAQRHGHGQTAHIAPLAAKRAAPLPMPPPDAPGPSAVKLEALEANQCRWRHDTPEGYLFCGCPTIPGTSWCPDHHARVFRPFDVVPMRRREVPQRQVTFYERQREDA